MIRENDLIAFRINDWPDGQEIRGRVTRSDTHPDVLELLIPGDGGRYWVATGKGPFEARHRTVTVLARRAHNCPDCTHQETP